MKLYVFLIYIFCSSLLFSQDISMQNGTFNRCAPDKFFDSGGEFGNYSSNENLIVTICPENTGDFVQLNFLSFNSQLGQDTLTIYDGDDTTATPLLSLHSGINSPGIISASAANTSGCLTVEFISNGSGNGTGWEADILCSTACQDITAEISSTVPSASNGVIQISPGTTVDFTGSATFSDNDTNTTLVWDFGEGAPANGTNVSHTYNNPGTFNVTFTASDDNPTGCQATATVTVLVLEPIITVNNPAFSESSMSLQNLVENVLVTGGCVGVSAFSEQVSGAPSDLTTKSYGYFTRGGATDFPFEEGIVITSGRAADGGNALDGGALTTTDLAPGGDADLQNALGTTNTNDATFVKFNFVPTQNNISFRYIMASEEYRGIFECSYTDGFAFLLRELGTTTYQNLAVLPNGDPVAVTNVHDTSCLGGPAGGVNPAFFEGNSVGTNYEAQTVVLTASATVIPNTTYEIKLVVADDRDSNYDTAIFLEAGSFNLGGDLGDDITIAANTAECAGTPVTLDTGATTATHTWSLDGNVLTGETSSTLQVTTPGMYTVVVEFAPGCEATDSILVEFRDNPVANPVTNLSQCLSTGTLFDLTENTSEVLGAQPAADFEVTYHPTEQDAIDNTAVINNPDTYNGTDGEIIWIRIADITQTCFETISFTLNLTSTATINAAPNLEACDTLPNDGFALFDLGTQDATILGTQSAADFTVSYHTSFADADAGTGALPLTGYTNTTANIQDIFVRVTTLGDTDCYSATATPHFQLIVNPSDTPSFTLTADCESATAMITGTTGGIFSFDPVPTDGATIDATTGAISNGTPSTTYTVRYTTSGVCPATATQDVTILAEDDASFTMSATCDGATATVTGTTGGIFSLDPVPTDGATIDATTGAISNGTPSTTYIVRYTTTGVCPETTTESITVFPEEDASFTLAASCDGATATITGNTGGIFSLDPVPTDGATIDATTGAISNGTPSAIYTVRYTTTGNCPATTTQDVTVLDEDDASFTLTADCNGGTAIVTGTIGGTFSFDPLPTDSAVIDPLTGTVSNATPNTIYTIRYTTPGQCSATQTSDLVVLPLDDISFSVMPSCDGGTVSLSGVSGGVFTLDPAPTDGAIIDPVTGTVTNGTPNATYTIRYSVNAQCANTGTQILTVHPQPAVVIPTPLEVCDDGIPDGLTEMDLTVKTAEITGNNTSVVTTYYEQAADAQAGVNAIADPTQYTNLSNGQIIHVRVADASTGCFDTTTLTLVVEQAPVANTPEALRFCDPDSDGFGVFDLTQASDEITGGVVDLMVTYYTTFTNAQNGVDAIANPDTYANVNQNTQLVFARVESSTISTECETIVPLELIVEPTPQLMPTTALEVCDDDADGLAEFDLSLKNAEILGGLDALQYQITYYETEEDANMDTNPIGTPMAYTNTVADTQQIWVRVEDTNTGVNPTNHCYTVLSLQLIVNPLPVLTQPMALRLCDVTMSGDEQEAFNLEAASSEILGGQTGIILSYYETQADADAAINAIADPTAYTNTTMNPQTLFVRGEDEITGCYSVVLLTIEVSPLPSPLANPLPIEVCDDDADGIADFDLNVRTADIINGEADVEVSYYETQADANSGVNSINLTQLYTNTVPNSQTIFVRVESTVTGCFTVLDTLELNVLPTPELPTSVSDLVVCDTDSNGEAMFDLTSKAAELLGNQDPTVFILSYHERASDAASGLLPITNPTNYTNRSVDGLPANPQTIFVRLENTAADNRCVRLGSFTIRVDLPPVVAQPEPLVQCDDLGEANDTITSFDLTQRNTEITGGNPSYTVSYYETQADAAMQTNAIADPENYSNTSVNGLPANPQTLYVVVTDTATSCTSQVTLTLTVLPNPTPTPSDDLPALEQCDDPSGDGQATFNLLGINNAQEDLILNNENNVTPSYYTSLEGALTEDSAALIADPTTHISGTATIFVRVSNNTTGCFTIVSFDIIVHPLPSVAPLTDIVECELNTDGIATFDLTQQNADVLNGQDATQFIVNYYETEADAQQANNAIATPEAYENRSVNGLPANPQQIYVTITNTTTGCYIATQRFFIQVDEDAQANADMQTIVYEICDDEIDNDSDTSNNSAAFDLSTISDLVDFDANNPAHQIQAQVLDGQDPSDYVVSYYATQADADAAINALPNTFENTSNTQTIYARVDNNTLGLEALSLDITALNSGATPPENIDLDGNGTTDLYDTDGDGIYDLVDVENDGISDVLVLNAVGLIAYIDFDDDGEFDFVNIDSDITTFENQADGSQCYAIAEIVLQVNPLPVVDISGDYILCNMPNGTEVIEPLVLDTGLSPAVYSFEWLRDGVTLAGATGPSFSPTAPGSYTVIVTDTSSSTQTMCASTSTATVSESTPPEVSYTVTEAFSDGHTITLSATPVGGNYEYRLNQGPWQQNNIFTNVPFGEHVVRVRDREGCGYVDVRVIAIGHPKFFTPNGDGNNDTWMIKNLPVDSKIYIFDRMGKLIKQITSNGPGWDGTYNGRDLPSSDYWFVVEYAQIDIPTTTIVNKQYRNHFTLKR